MKLADNYPEALRGCYEHVEEVVIEAGAASPTFDIALYVTEWIRSNWGGRTLLPYWWGAVETRADAEQDLPGVVTAIDQVKTARGRELRAAVWEIVVTQAPGVKSCYLASAIAERIEAQWYRKPIYVPKAAAMDRAIRDAQIWRDFGGFSSLDRVVKKYDLSQSVIYDIYRRLQHNKEEREQPVLPGM